MYEDKQGVIQVWQVDRYTQCTFWHC